MPFPSPYAGACMLRICLLPPPTPPHPEPRQQLPRPLQLLHTLYAVCCLFVFRPGHTSDDVRECVQAHSRCTVWGRAQQAGVPGGCEWNASPLHKKGSAEARCACSTTSKHRDSCDGQQAEPDSGFKPTGAHSSKHARIASAQYRARSTVHRYFACMQFTAEAPPRSL